MPAALVANLINLGHSEKLMISELEKRITFATRLKFKFENVFVKRLRLCKIINLDRHVIAPIDLNAHTAALCANDSLISMLLTSSQCRQEDFRLAKDQNSAATGIRGRRIH